MLAALAKYCQVEVRKCDFSEYHFDVQTVDESEAEATAPIQLWNPVFGRLNPWRSNKKKPYLKENKLLQFRWKPILIAVP
jgi:hypothetical protein